MAHVRAGHNAKYSQGKAEENVVKNSEKMQENSRK